VSATADQGCNAVLRRAAWLWAISERWATFRTHQQRVRKASLLVNTAHSGNHWSLFKTVGTRSIATDRRKDHSQGCKETMWMKCVVVPAIFPKRSGVHFGLGSAMKIDAVHVRWPSGLWKHFDTYPSMRSTR